MFKYEELNGIISSLVYQGDTICKNKKLLWLDGTNMSYLFFHSNTTSGSAYAEPALFGEIPFHVQH